MSENQNNLSFDDPIDELLNQLEQDKEKPREISGITKINMAFSDNHGMVMLAPYQGEVNGKKSFYTLIPGVKEYKCPVTMIDEGKTPLWVRILPKEFYGNLNPDQSKLYDQVSGLFDQVKEAHEESDSWRVIRYRSYSLMYGVLLKHTDKTGKLITDNVGKGVLVVFPSKAPISELATAIKNQTSALNGNKAWVSRIFTVKDGIRNGALLINFERPETGGYSASVSFATNNEFAKIVEPEYSEEITKFFKDPVEDFLGWQNGKDSKFNSDLFREIAKNLSLEINDPGNPEVIEPQENKNGVDPVLTPKAEVNPVGIPGISGNPGLAGIEGVDKLPF